MSDLTLTIVLGITLAFALATFCAAAHTFIFSPILRALRQRIGRSSYRGEGK
jgi:hypothetical protein